MIADLVREGNLTHHQVLEGGYFEMHRLWSMLLERRAADFMSLARTLDWPHMKDEGRSALFDELKGQQPRRFKCSQIPEHVLRTLKEKFNG